MPTEDKYTHGRNRLCRNDKLWTSRDEQSAENEVGQFIGSLIRLLKPQLVLETGCYLGNTTIEMAKAIKDNGFGELVSCDTISDRVDQVSQQLKVLNLSGEIFHMSGTDLIKKYGDKIEFAFIDSGNEEARESEINLLIPLLKPANMFLMHDTGPQFTGYSEIADLVELPKVYFNTPRGLTLFMKPRIN